MSGPSRTVRIADLIGSTVVTVTGERVGRVADIAVMPGPRYAVTELDLGTAGWMERMGIARVFGFGLRTRREPHRVPWSDVADFDGRTVTLKPGRGNDRQPAAS
jgi:sporulation protein YlmC with PRC-barrel domain